MLDMSRSLDEGAILVPGYPVGSPGWHFHATYERIDPAKKLRDYGADELDALLHGGDGTVEITFAGGRPSGCGTRACSPTSPGGTSSGTSAR
jgi:hypothetical protein